MPALPKQKVARHNELWAQGSKGVGRLIVGTLLFAGLVVAKVFDPLVADSHALSGQKKQLVRVRGDLVEVEKQRARTEQLEKRLEVVKATISRQPWMGLKDRLVSEIAAVNESYRTLERLSPREIEDALSPSVPSPIQAPPPPNPVKEAAQRLAVDRLPLQGIADSSFPEFLEKQYRVTVQAAANRAVRDIEASVEKGVVLPLQELAETDQAARAQVQRMAKEFGDDLTRWSEAHLDDPDWYRTIQQKSRELRDLTKLLDERQTKLAQPVKAKLRQLEQERERITGQETKLREQHDEITDEMKELDKRLHTILPSWLRGMVSAPEMLQLYPGVLVVLVLLIAYRARRVRSHYIVVRESHEPPNLSFQDPAMSSVWTLVWRGASATAITALVYGGGSLLLWALFERGVAQLSSWLESDWGRPFVSSTLVTAVLWVGRIVFVLGVAGAVRCLLRDRRTALAA